MSNLQTARDQWRQLAVPIFVMAVLVAGGGYFYFSNPSEEAQQRQNICRNWGYTDEASLARCARSQNEADAVIAPKFQQAKRNAIRQFNSELDGLSNSKTLAVETDYSPGQLGPIEKATGGMFPSVTSHEKAALEGQRFKLTGRIVTETPDLSDDNNEGKPWEPRAYSLWGPEAKSKNAVPAMLGLDIEGLNRYERKFIQDHCGMIGFTRCDAVILGHVGTIKRDEMLEYRGIIVDEVTINPMEADGD